jgi:type IX secretion system PorP/SprF family membrane protein
MKKIIQALEVVVISASILVAIGLPSSAEAQDPHFSQYYNVPQYYNAARTGSIDGRYRASGHYRKQYTASTTGYTTNGADVQFNFLYSGSSHFSAGAFVLNDNAGPAQIKQLQVLGSGAYHLKMSSKDVMSVGVQLGILQRSINIEGMSWDAQYNGVTYDPSLDNKESFGAMKNMRYDAGIGGFWKHEGKVAYSGGYALRHFGQNQSVLGTNQDKLPIRQTLTGSIKGFYNHIHVQGDILYQRQKSAVELMLGVRGEYRIGTDSKYTKVNTSSGIIGGVYYRVREAISPMIGFEWKKIASLYVSYDIPITGVSKVVGIVGGPEFSFVYQGGFGDRNKKVVK